MTEKSRKLAHKAIIAQEKKRLDDLYSQPLKLVHDYSFTDQELDRLDFLCFYDDLKTFSISTTDLIEYGLSGMTSGMVAVGLYISRLKIQVQ